MQMAINAPNFNFLALLVSEIKRSSVPKFNVGGGYSCTPYAETFMCAPSTWQKKIKQPAKFQHRILMHHAVMRICISHMLSMICAQNGVFEGFEGEDVKILCYIPTRHCPA